VLSPLDGSYRALYRGLSIVRAGGCLARSRVVDGLGADLSVPSGIVMQTGSCCMLDFGRLPTYCWADVERRTRHPVWRDALA
jgi:hypothetical protein